MNRRRARISFRRSRAPGSPPTLSPRLSPKPIGSAADRPRTSGMVRPATETATRSRVSTGAPAALAGDRDLLSEVVDPPVDTRPAEALLADLIQQALVIAPAAPDHRAKDHEPGAFRHLLYPVRHLLDGLLVNLDHRWGSGEGPRA